MSLTQQQLGEKRARKRLRRKRIIMARLRAYGEKSVPYWVKVVRKHDPLSTQIQIKLNLWQRFKAWLKKFKL